MFPIRRLPATRGLSSISPFRFLTACPPTTAFALAERSGLSPPFGGREKTQAFFLDPDGHLIEIWQARGKEEVTN
jgi:catechol 2,3-dioxygenase-like lactoylglutathione lyase family enzyme